MTPMNEREAIVAWLEAQAEKAGKYTDAWRALTFAAARIKGGDHLKGKSDERR